MNLSMKRAWVAFLCLSLFVSGTAFGYHFGFRKGLIDRHISIYTDEGIIPVIASDFKSTSLKRCLDYYVANFSSHATNHFYVGAVEIDKGQLVRAMIYWKEERRILLYGELNADAPKGSEIEAFGGAWGDGLRLDRDTVDTPDEIAGSTYLVTHREWVTSMEDCISRGKPYCILRKDAARLFPNTK